MSAHAPLHAPMQAAAAPDLHSHHMPVPRGPLLAAALRANNTLTALGLTRANVWHDADAAETLLQALTEKTLKERIGAVAEKRWGGWWARRNAARWCAWGLQCAWRRLESVLALTLRLHCCFQNNSSNEPNPPPPNHTVRSWLSRLPNQQRPVTRKRQRRERCRKQCWRPRGRCWRQIWVSCSCLRRQTMCWPALASRSSKREWRCWSPGVAAAFSPARSAACSSHTTSW